jgi:hypothetical protein
LLAVAIWLKNKYRTVPYTILKKSVGRAKILWEVVKKKEEKCTPVGGRI